MFNKPVGCVSARVDANNKTILDYFQGEDISELRIVGRLDKNTHGLIFVTDDTKWLEYVTNPANKIEKKYFFWSMSDLYEKDLSIIEEGVVLTGAAKVTSPARIELTGKSTFGQIRHLITGRGAHKLLKNKDDFPVTSGYITVTEGKKHEVRRLLKATGGCVIYLKRVSMAGIELDDTLLPGCFKRISVDYNNSSTHKNQ